MNNTEVLMKQSAIMVAIMSAMIAWYTVTEMAVTLLLATFLFQLAYQQLVTKMWAGQLQGDHDGDE